jgi:hypothetical protein
MRAKALIFLITFINFSLLMADDEFDVLTSMGTGQDVQSR